MSCPYRILIGPLFNPDYLGDYQHDPNIRIFKHRNAYEPDPGRFHILYDMAQTFNFGHILAQLEPGWEPDIVIWWDAVYQGLPPGIEDCPYPTALIVGDWNVGALQSLVHAEMFDALLADRSFLAVMAQHQHVNGLYWPGFSFQPALHRPLALARDIDIAFVGNLNSSVHLERSLLLDQILQLRDRHRVVVSQGLWKEDYVTLLNRSKIVFNYSVRGEMNMRAYEAPACGALLFMEADNLEVRDFLTDRQHCVLYTPENLHDLLTYYLSHEEERAALAAAGQQQIQAYTYHRQFEQLLSLIPTVQAWHRQRPRPYLQRAASERLLFDVRQLFYALSYGSSELGRQLLARLPALTGPLTRAQAAQLNGLAVLLTPALAPGVERSGQTETLLEHLLSWFTLCHEAEPQHPVYRYHQGFICESQRQWGQAEAFYLDALECLEQAEAADYLYQTRFYVLPSPQFRTHNSFPTEWEQLCVTSLDMANQALVVRFKEQLWQCIGLLRYYLHRWQDALDAFNRLTLISNRGIFWFWKARIYRAWEQPHLALECFQAALARDPFLIGQMGSLFSGADFAAMYADLRPWLERYADIFPVVNDYYQLMCVLEASAPKRLALLTSHYSLRWMQLLLSLQKTPYAFDIPVFQAPVRVAFSALQPPESPRLLPQAPFLQWVAPADAEVVFERVWGLGSWDEHRLSVAELPALFEPVSDAPVYEGVGQMPYLLLLPDALPIAVCVSVLLQFESDYAHQELQLVLWSPDFSEAEWDVLIATIPEHYQAHVSVLSAPLSPLEQQGLFAHAQAVLGGSALYLWWAMWLGTPVALVADTDAAALPQSWESLYLPYWFPGQTWPQQRTDDTRRLSERMHTLYRRHYPQDVLAHFWRWAFSWRADK
jgi:tetratricopeptide (TPR) repeat protein